MFAISLIFIVSLFLFIQFLCFLVFGIITLAKDEISKKLKITLGIMLILFAALSCILTVALLAA